MALAKRCDRCGKLYEHYPVGNKSEYNALKIIQRNKNGETINVNTVYDLCPECMSEFMKFITKRRVRNDKI